MNKLYVLILLIFPLSVNAHTGGESLLSMADGFSHPFLGIDHLLIMIAIGFWAVASKSVQLWVLPVVFLLAMFIGAMLSFSGLDINGMEYLVAFSVLCSGFILWQSKDLSVLMTIGLVVVFALAHGYVHAVELEGGANAFSYVIGFLMATAILHAIGMVAGLFGPSVVKSIKTIFGLICTLIGLAFLVSI